MAVDGHCALCSKDEDCGYYSATPNCNKKLIEILGEGEKCLACKTDPDCLGNPAGSKCKYFYDKS